MASCAKWKFLLVGFQDFSNTQVIALWLIEHFEEAEYANSCGWVRTNTWATWLKFDRPQSLNLYHLVDKQVLLCQRNQFNKRVSFFANRFFSVLWFKFCIRYFISVHCTSYFTFFWALVHFFSPRLIVWQWINVCKN